jgi:hypothetical protein
MAALQTDLAVTNKVEVVPLGIADAPEMARFFSRQSPGGSDKYETYLERLHWYARNPAAREDVPLGWGVRSQDALVGAMLCIPVDFIIDGKQTCLLMSSSFYVDAAHRGCGLPIFFAYRALDRRYVLYASTANQLSSRLWQTCKAKPIPRTEYELIGAIRWAPLVEETAFRKLGNMAGALASKLGFLANLRPALGTKAGRQAALTRLTRPEDAVLPQCADSRFELLRDSSFLKWRYFDQPQAKFDLYHVTAPGANACIAVTLGTRGYRDHIRALNIADIWGLVNLAAIETMIAALAAEYASAADIIVLRGFDETCESEALRVGFLRRPFAQPIGWYIDRAGLVPHQQMRLAPAATDQL